MATQVVSTTLKDIHINIDMNIDIAIIMQIRNSSHDLKHLQLDCANVFDKEVLRSQGCLFQVGSA